MAGRGAPRHGTAWLAAAGMPRVSGAVRLHPAWRHALQMFRQHGFRAGELITHDWLYEAFSIQRPTSSTPKSVADRAELACLGQFNRLADALLNEDKVALTTVRGLGYRVVPPGDQTGWAEAECRAGMAKVLRQSGERIRNVDLTRLTADQRRENADAQARLAALRSVTRQTYRKLPVLAGDTGKALP